MFGTKPIIEKIGQNRQKKINSKKTTFKFLDIVNRSVNLDRDKNINMECLFIMFLTFMKNRH